MKIDNPSTNFAMWLLNKTGVYASPFNQHSTTPELVAEFIDADTWIGWCRNMAFKVLMHEYQEFLPPSVKEVDLQRVISISSDVRLIVEAIQSFPDEFPKVPLNEETLCKWEDTPELDLYPSSDQYICDQLRQLWNLYQTDESRYTRIINRPLFNKFRELMAQNQHYYFLVRYPTQATLALTPLVSIYGENY
ncbi:hypothetical protein [Pantanalinema sp. GBBB05]|uniref:hypothetical protein n=1 Tax=Pantanalinema sp. GBBB05 TaxID=2604139 RepID=UPI001D8C7DE5|nr:hypothetical protein [Pantanalinema sp. GBBB05]